MGVALSTIRTYYRDGRLPVVKIRGSRLHESGKASFPVALGTGLWSCPAGAIPDNAHQFAERLGVNPPATTATTLADRIVATYPYTDERGELLFQVVRFPPKDFRQR